MQQEGKGGGLGQGYLWPWGRLCMCRPLPSLVTAEQQCLELVGKEGDGCLHDLAALCVPCCVQLGMQRAQSSQQHQDFVSAETSTHVRNSNIEKGSFVDLPDSQIQS